MGEFTERELDDAPAMLPPFYTDCRANTRFGRGVFANSGCQEQGRLTIGGVCFIGYDVAIATLNHEMQLALRDSLRTVPVVFFRRR